MARFLAQKHFGSLRPADEAGAEVLRKIANGKFVTVEVKQSRNLQHHRLFWALMTTVWNNLEHDRYPTVEDFAGAVKICLGLRTRIELPNGTIGFIPGSIAFHNMDQVAFSAFYDRVCDLIAEHFLPGVSSDELRREVEIMIGVAA
jgi:hypothetical protein